jgi:hypothetical protein
MANERLLIVEESFAARGKAVHLSPKITIDEPPRGPVAVRLRLPSGEEREAKAVFEVPHIRGSLPPFAIVKLLDLTPEEVPVGTEVFRVE